MTSVFSDERVPALSRTSTRHRLLGTIVILNAALNRVKDLTRAESDYDHAEIILSARSSTFPLTTSVKLAVVRSLAPALPPLRMTLILFDGRVPKLLHTSTRRRQHDTCAAAGLRGRRGIRGGRSSCK